MYDYLFVDKAGHCPKSDVPHNPISKCGNSCTSDDECRGDSKCCYGPSGCPECLSPVADDKSCKPACQNGGTCSKGYCNCPDGFVGISCEIGMF